MDEVKCPKCNGPMALVETQPNGDRIYRCHDHEIVVEGYTLTQGEGK